MKLIQIAGWLGSGKTTLIIALGKGLSEMGTRVAILVNDIGAVPVDGKVIQEYGLTVKEIGGGCICCQVAGNMLNTLRLLSEGQNPDVVIVEPTGVAVPSSIRDTILTGARQFDISMGPIIVLFDTTREDKLLNYESLKRLVTAQLKDADIIALSKADMVTDEVLKRAGEAMRLINSRAQVISLSTHEGDGLSTLIQAAHEIVARV
ncbi:MAG: GTP-binding protein [Nitrospirota bacterium]